MKYWPLTAVLLAFWLGRETGADDKAAPKVAEFGDIRCSGIQVRDPKKPGATTVILADGLRVRDETSMTEVYPGSVTVLGGASGAGAKQEHAFYAMMTASDTTARVAAKSVKSGYDSGLFAKKDYASVMAGNTKEYLEKTNRGTARLWASKGVRKLVVTDKRGTDRAVLGTAEVVNKKTGAKTTYPESTLTLFDAKGEFYRRISYSK